MKKLIKVSRPPSGLCFVVPPDAMDVLGGYGHRVRLGSVQSFDNGTIKVMIVKDDKHGTARVTERMKFTNQRLALEKEDIPEFGMIGLKWEPSGNGLSFIIPKAEELDPPNPHPHVKTRRLSKKSDDTTPHARLGAAIRTINEICASGNAPDVTFSVPANSAGTEYSASTFRITAKRVIEEILS